MSTDFTPMQTRFEESEFSSTHSAIDVNGEHVVVSPGESTRVVEWMAKRTAENVAWLKHRDLILGTLKIVQASLVRLQQDESPLTIGQLVECGYAEGHIYQALAAAVPEEG